jgi:hypothetical protein
VNDKYFMKPAIRRGLVGGGEQVGTATEAIVLPVVRGEDREQTKEEILTFEYNVLTETNPNSPLTAAY